MNILFRVDAFLQMGTGHVMGCLTLALALGFQWGDFPQAEQYYQEAMSLPLYYGLTETDQDRVVQTLQEVLQ